MVWVSCSLLAWSREISSWMLTAEPEGTCFSSSIFASSSAIGCSKSRKFTAMGREDSRRNPAGPSGGLPVDRTDPGADRRRAVEHGDAAAAQQGLELLDQCRRGPYVPVGAKRKRAA